MRTTALSPHPASHQVAWHRAECWGYRADLELWRELAGPVPKRVLDLGCGTGRVALDLARCGHHVTGLDRDPVLLAALDEAGAGVETIVADIRDFDLGERFDLVIAPMQTLQLLTDTADRRVCLLNVRRHMHEGSLFAAALVDLALPRDARPVAGANLLEGTPAPTDSEPLGPDLVAGSTSTALYLDGSPAGPGELRIRRLRHVRERGSGRLRDSQQVEYVLALLDPKRIDNELEAAGLRPVGRRPIAPTATHMGSTVLLAEAAPEAAAAERSPR